MIDKEQAQKKSSWLHGELTKAFKDQNIIFSCRASHEDGHDFCVIVQPNDIAADTVKLMTDVMDKIKALEPHASPEIMVFPPCTF